MSTITREQLRERAREKVKSLEFSITQTAFADSRAELEEELELARIALASLEAEPVAYIFKHPAGRLFWSLTDESNKGQSDVMPVYTTPPAPVSVPDERPSLNNGIVGFDEGWNACRAAMLQGAEPDFREISNSSTKNFRENAETSTKCWCHTCRPVTFSDSRLVVCPECGNKRCPHANDHRNACTGSNEPGQEGSAYPAAPQQEMKNG